MKALPYLLLALLIVAGTLIYMLWSAASQKSKVTMGGISTPGSIGTVDSIADIFQGFI